MFFTRQRRDKKDDQVEASQLRAMITEVLEGKLDRADANTLTGLMDELRSCVNRVRTDCNYEDKLNTKVIQLRKEIARLESSRDTEVEALRFTKTKELREAELRRDIDQRDSAHFIRLKEESMEVAYEKKLLKLKSDYKDKELALQNGYFEKSIAQLDIARKEMKEVYNSIMACMPNVNLDVKRSTSNAVEEETDA